MTPFMTCQILPLFIVSNNILSNLVSSKQSVSPVTYADIGHCQSYSYKLHVLDPTNV